MGFEIDGLDELKQEMLSMVNEKFPIEKEKEMKKLALMATSQIKPLVNVDTGRLRNSVDFSPGSSTSEPFEGKSEGTILPIDEDTIEITTNVDYAKLVNDGFTMKKRFLPAKYLDTPAGRKYLKDGNTKGIMLKPKFIKGTHFFEKGLQNSEPQIMVEIDRWLNELIGKV